MPRAYGDFIDLKPDSNFIDANFDGYKLSLDAFHQYELRLPSPVPYVQANSTQFGLEHLKLFNDMNYLVFDSQNSSDSVKKFYAILDDSHLHSFTFDLKDNCFGSARINCGLKTPLSAGEQSERYPCSVSLTDQSYAFVADGAGYLSMFETGERTKDQDWKEIVCLEVEFKANKIGPFVIMESRRFGDSRIEVLLRTVVSRDKMSTERPKVLFWNKIYWLSFMLDGGTWSLKRTRELTSKGHLVMATLDFSGDDIIIIGTEEFSLSSDSDVEMMETDAAVDEIESKQQAGESGAKPMERSDAAYLWAQTSEDVSAVFKFPEKISKNDITMSLDSSSICLTHKGSDLIRGRLGGLVDVSCSTFTIDGGKLELTLFKAEPSAWTELVIGDERGVMEVDHEAMSAAYNRLEQFTSEFPALGESEANQSFNTGQLEECDASSDEITKLVWISGETQSVKRVSDISGNSVLFVYPTVGEPTNFCLRMDVDGILWSFCRDSSSSVIHKATFNAFGYVQASKTQKKFSTCSPDCSYALIVEAKRRAYLYWQPSPLNSDLRNRRSGQRVTGVAKQHLISISTQGEFGEAEAVSDSIIGTYAGNEALFLLTLRGLYAVVLN